jgi:hypothetical protein
MGFNASHSMGLILFGLIYGYLALAHGQLLFRSPFLLVVGLAMLCGLVALCKVYFLVGLSKASAFHWPAMWPALPCRVCYCRSGQLDAAGVARKRIHLELVA